MFSNIHNDLSAFAGECDHLSEAVRVYMNHTEQMLKKMASRDDDEYCGLFTETIPDLARSSTVIYICAIVEQKFNEACTLAKVHKKLRLHHNKFDGKGIVRANIYLKDYAQIDLKISDSEWDDIRRILNIRNFLVHGSRNDPNEKGYKELARYTEVTKAFKARDGSIWVTEKTVPFVLKKIDPVLGKLGVAITKL
jgi:hypothetical protein